MHCKYLTIIVFLLLILFVNCKKNVVVLQSNDELCNDIFYEEKGLCPFSGEVIVFFPGTKVPQQVSAYKDGKLHGPCKYFYRSGVLKREGFFNHGKETGEWRQFYENGSMEYEVVQKDGMMDGSFMVWYKNGKPKEKGTYCLNRINGKYTKWNEMGNIILE
jgi:uncharacterized protein